VLKLDQHPKEQTDRSLSSIPEKTILIYVLLRERSLKKSTSDTLIQSIIHIYMYTFIILLLVNHRIVRMPMRRTPHTKQHTTLL